MKSSYLALVHLGKNSWKRYLLSFLSFFVWAFIISIFSYLWLAFGRTAESYDFKEFLENQTWTIRYAYWIGQILSMLGVFYLIVEKVHKRKFLSLASVNKKINANKIIFSFSIFFFMRCMASVVLSIFHLNNYQLNLDANFWEWFASLALMIPMAILSGVGFVVVIGYLLQSVSLIIPSQYLLVAIFSLIFVPHSTGSIFSFVLRYLYGFFVLLNLTKCNCAEMIFGLRAANSLYELSIVRAMDSSDLIYFPGYTVFIVKDTMDLGAAIILAIQLLFFVFVAKRLRDNPPFLE